MDSAARAAFPLISRLPSVVNRPGWTHEDIAEWARPWVAYLQARAADSSDGQAMVDASLLDCTPFHVAEQSNGSLAAQALEKSSPHRVPLRYVVFRGLFLALAELESAAQPGPLPSLGVAGLCGAVMERLGIDVSEEEVAEFAARGAEERGRDHATLVREFNLGLNAFQSRLDRALKEYRSQRAWTVMLFARMAYAELLRKGWRGRLRFVGRLLAAPFRGMPGLERYELTFPNALDYTVRMRDASGAQGGHLYDVIVLPVFDFGFRFQRPQQLACEFARSGHRVFWISVSRPVPAASQVSYEACLERENIWEVHLRAKIPDVYQGKLDAEALEAILGCLQDLYRDWGIAENCVIAQLPFWRRVGLRLRGSSGAKLIFDCMDDWDAFPGIGEFNRAEQAELAREADVLTVSGEGLREAWSRRGAQPVLIRNGADFRFFANPDAAEPRPPVPHPVVGYIGAVADWFDSQLVREVARLRPQYSFVLVGGEALETNVATGPTASLRGEPNVSLLGHQPYARLPGYLANFDACILPFVVNAVTTAADPVKIYEYFSQGKPVVSTKLPELEHYGEMVYQAADAAEFAEKLDLAVSERDEGLRARRIDYARTNSWRERYRSLDAVVRERYAPVSVVIVSYNSAPCIGPCLDSLRRNTSYPNYEVIVVDNNSADGAAERISECARRDGRIRARCLSENLGFAAASNLGVSEAKGEYLILLNADTIVTVGWVERLVRHCRRDESVGAVVPVTNSIGNEARIRVSYEDLESMEKFAAQIARENAGSSRELEVAALFCALIPRRVWDSVGQLDERFEVGMFEDDDFSLRLRRAGLRVVTAEDCFVHHFGRASFSQLATERYGQLFEQNRRLFEEKWNTKWQAHRSREGMGEEERQFSPSRFAPAFTLNGAQSGTIEPRRVPRG